MKHALARRCCDCPKRTKAVCRHAFGVFWCIKSCDGEGCAHPLDDVAEAWRKAGWTLGTGMSAPQETPVVDVKKPVERKMKRRYVQEELLNATMPLTDDDY